MVRSLDLGGKAMDIMLLTRKGYCCSQIMALLMLREMGRENPELVRAMGGLCYGMGYSGDTCWALAGGACLISLLAGKGADDQSEKAPVPLMLTELVDWFRGRTEAPYGSMKCDDILAASPDKSACLELVSKTYDKVLSILAAHGLEPLKVS